LPGFILLSRGIATYTYWDQIRKPSRGVEHFFDNRPKLEAHKAHVLREKIVAARVTRLGANHKLLHYGLFDCGDALLVLQCRLDIELALLATKTQSKDQSSPRKLHSGFGDVW